MLLEIERVVGFPIRGERIEIGEGAAVNVDGMNRDARFVCEIFSRIGKLQAAQVEKVASDILKLMLIERRLGGRWRKAMCFASDAAANVLRNRSWLASAAADAGIEVLVAALPKEIEEAVLVAQRRQVMVNKAGSGR